MALHAAARLSALSRFASAAALLAAAHGANAAVMSYDLRPLYQTAIGAAPQTTIDFEDTRYADGTGSGFIPTFTKAGYVTFNANPNFQQEVISGFNVGQQGNDVYLVQAFNKALPTLDITFGRGVMSFGFDFKNSSNNNGTASLVPQLFTFTLFSGATNLGSFSAATMIGGANFSFLGFTSDQAITEITAVATVPGASPNLDLVLDNLTVGAQAVAAGSVPEPATLTLLGAGVLTAGFASRRRRQKAA